MGENEQMAKAVEDYNNFLILNAKGDKPAAESLLKQIDLRLVTKHYKDFKVNSKQEPTFNLVSAMAELFKLKDEYEKYRADGGKALAFFEGKEG